MQSYIAPLSDAINDLEIVTAEVLNTASQNSEELGTAANDYLHLFGYTAMAYMWSKMAQVSLDKKDSGDEFFVSKIHTANYFFAKLLPRRHSLIATIKSGSDTLFDINDELF